MWFWGFWGCSGTSSSMDWAGWTLAECQTFKKTFWPFTKCHQVLSPVQALTTHIFLWKFSLFWTQMRGFGMLKRWFSAFLLTFPPSFKLDHSLPGVNKQEHGNPEWNHHNAEVGFSISANFPSAVSRELQALTVSSVCILLFYLKTWWGKSRRRRKSCHRNSNDWESFLCAVLPLCALVMVLESE